MGRHGGGTLPGDGTERYARVPAVVMLVLAPMMGAAYVIFLPLVGFAMVVDFAARRLWRLMGKAVWAMMAAVAPSWRPGEAYLAERGQKDTAPASESAEHRESPKRDA